jgi:protein tyrosine phosphatase
MISDEQAAQLVHLLEYALHNHMNVIVHCHAGICRSGAIVEVATMMGFTDTKKWRSPNLRVKHKMMQVLGLAFDPNELHRMKPEHMDYLDACGEIGNV